MEKLIVTNATALARKYGPEGVATLRAAFERLVAADRERSLESVVIELDNTEQMKTYGAAAVSNPESARQHKTALDALDAALSPAYIMIVGAPDVVPHQSLANPLYDGAHDPDRYVFSDLPYACDASFGNDVGRFAGPTRVVGRLPDINGGTDPSYLVALLETAAGWRSRPRSEYAQYLGISTQAWEDSTALSLLNVFGSSDDMQIVPPREHQWDVSLLARRSHFINCHGALSDPRYYGQRGGHYPVAHDARYLTEQPLEEGTVVSAECCYGAELYNPVLAGNVMSLCNTYLLKKAYAFFGSSTIAYGPANGNGSADFICQFFLNNVLAGASTGRGALEARQEFVRRSGMLDPVDLKTLAQFNLMGDPSVQPVVAPISHAVQGDPTRSVRRRQMREAGRDLGISTPVAKRSRSKAPTADEAIEGIVKAASILHPRVLTYSMRGGNADGGTRKGPAAGGETKVRVILGERIERASGDLRLGAGLAIVVWEENGKVVSYRELHQR